MDTCFGLTQIEIAFYGMFFQSVLSLLTLLTIIYSFYKLRVSTHIDSVRTINARFNDLNDMLTSNELAFIDRNDLSSFETIKEYAKDGVVYNKLNLLEGLYEEMRHGMIKRSYASTVLNSYAKKVMKDERAVKLLSPDHGYNQDFVSYCLKFVNTPQSHDTAKDPANNSITDTPLSQASGS